tara:strand:- start:5505 stop:5858 length:354 start_codon:yes stop_codon:yes gene_type:complete
MTRQEEMEKAYEESQKVGMQGRIFYSDARPKDSEWDIKYSERDYNLMNIVVNTPGTDVPKDSVKVAQQILLKHGLLNKEGDDTYLGEETLGAARRYLYNNDGAHIWNWIKDKNPFKD